MYTTSVNFLKMISQAGEIQLRRDPTRGNLYWDVYLMGNHTVGIKYNEKIFNIWNNEIRDLKRYVWIPTMLQLQIIHWKLVREKGVYGNKEFQRFLLDSTLISARIFDNHSKSNKIVLTSLEEAYLATMYLTLFDKAWNGKAWVKIKKKRKKRNKEK